MNYHISWLKNTRWTRRDLQVWFDNLVFIDVPEFVYDKENARDGVEEYLSNILDVSPKFRKITLAGCLLDGDEYYWCLVSNYTKD